MNPINNYSNQFVTTDRFPPTQNQLNQESTQKNTKLCQKNERTVCELSNTKKKLLVPNNSAWNDTKSYQVC